MKFFVTLLISLFFANAVFAQAVVVDGDSLEMQNVRIRLQGIDAPEYYQDCFDAEGKKYQCGEDARRYLKELVNKGKISCVENDVDIYDRKLCTCYVQDKASGITINVNEEMVKSGWAMAYRGDKSYEKMQKQAKKDKMGVWQGKFMKPELYRILKK